MAASKADVEAENAHTAVHGLVVLELGVEAVFSAAAEGDVKPDSSAAEDLGGFDQVADLAGGTAAEVGIGTLRIADVPVSKTVSLILAGGPKRA